jgi:hypothetical protein
MAFDPQNCSWTLQLEIEMEDFYNFNKGQFDIATGLPDDFNGRFELAGWAKSFYSRGKLVRTISWNAGQPPVGCGSISSSVSGVSGKDRDTTPDRTRDRDRRGRDAWTL